MSKKVLLLLSMYSLMYAAQNQIVLLPNDVWLKIIEMPVIGLQDDYTLLDHHLPEIIEQKNVLQLFAWIDFLEILVCLNSVNHRFHGIINNKYPNPSLKRWSLSECLKYNLIDALNVGKKFAYLNSFDPIQSASAAKTLFFYINYKLTNYIFSFSIKEILVDHLPTVLHIKDRQYSLFTDESASYVPIANAYIAMMNVLLKRLFAKTERLCIVSCSVPIHVAVGKAFLIKNKQIIERLNIDVIYVEKNDNNHVYAITQTHTSNNAKENSITSKCTIV